MSLQQQKKIQCCKFSSLEYFWLIINLRLHIITDFIPYYFLYLFMIQIQANSFPNFLSFQKKLSTMAIAKNPTKTSPKKKERIFSRAFVETWEQFTSTTTIHGLKHVNDPRGNRFTKLFWIFVPVFCFVCAIALMATFLMRYKSSPTRINVDTNFGPISEIEFPAIIFCNPNFITDSQVHGLKKSL
jgi:Amiloride-sensitive sodium channel